MKPVRSFLFFLSSTVALAASGHEPGSAKPPPIPAVKESAGGLLKACSASAVTPRGRLRLRYCYGFLTGVEETMRVIMGKQNVLCPPPAVTIRELSQVYVRYASARPEVLQLSAVTVVARALQDRFPCNPQPEPGRERDGSS